MALVTYLIPELSKVKVTAFPLVAGELGISLIGDWDYPRYSLAAEAYQPGRVTGTFEYPGYTASGFVTDGAPFLPPVYLFASPALVIIEALPLGADSVRLSQPLAGQWNYPKYGASGRVEFVGVGVGAWDYPGYSAEGVIQQNGAVFGDWEYPKYDAFGGSISAEGRFLYPGYSADGFVASGSIGDWFYPRYEFEGGIVEVPDNAVMADFVYSSYEAEAEVIQQISGVLVANYWSYSASGVIGIQYGNAAWDYPGYDASGTVAQNGAVVGDWEYPGYSAEGIVDRYGLTDGAWDYPRYGFDGFIGFPGVGVGIWNYPTYQLSGTLGDKVTGKKRRQILVIRKW
jgi:hypothetical protein